MISSLFGNVTRERSLIVWILIGLSCIVGIFRAVGLTSLSVVFLLFFVMFGVCSSRNQIRVTNLLENALLSGNLVLFAIYLLRELGFVQRSFVSPAIVLAVIILLLTQFAQGVIRRNSELTVFDVQKICVQSLSLAVIPSGIYLASMSLPVSSMLRWLGYGYDNYGHLAQARLISSDAQTFFTRTNTALPLLSNTAQAGGSILSGIHTVISGSFRIEDWLLTFSLASLGLILAMTALLVRSASRQRITTTGLVTGLIFVSILGYGHLGRIWVNGFFASNLATFAFCLFVGNNLRRQSLSVGRGAVQIALIASVWPLLGAAYISIVFWWLSPDVRKVFRRSKSQYDFRLSRKSRLVSRMLRTSVVTVAILQVLLTYLTIRRDYSVTHFLTDGGIEPAYASTYLACGLLLVAMVLTLQVPNLSIREIGLATSFLTATALLFAVTYRYSGSVNYYATKTIVGLTWAFVCFVVVLRCERFKKKIARSNQVAFNVLVLVFALLQIYQAPPRSEMTFTGPFQGRVLSSFKGVVQNEPGPMDAEMVSEVIRGFCGARPALYWSGDYESELTTRWVNSLRGLWDNSSWSIWLELRGLISRDFVSSEDWAEADSLIVQNGFSLIVDGASLDAEFVSNLSKRLPRSSQSSQICIYSRL